MRVKHIIFIDQMVELLLMERNYDNQFIGPKYNRYCYRFGYHYE